MSSTASTKQQPVLTRLHDTLALAHAYANAIRDNAQDDRQPITADDLAGLLTHCTAILNALDEAHHLPG